MKLFEDHARRQKAAFLVNVRPEIQELYDKQEPIGVLTWSNLRLNSWERHLLLPLVTDAVLLGQLNMAMGNISMKPKTQYSHPPATYEESLMTTLVPELLKRYYAKAFCEPASKVRPDSGEDVPQCESSVSDPQLDHG